MIKEETRFAASNIMEGMTSISALLAAKAAGVNDRPIFEIRFDKAKKEKRNCKKQPTSPRWISRLFCI